MEAVEGSEQGVSPVEGGVEDERNYPNLSD